MLNETEWMTELTVSKNKQKPLTMNGLSLIHTWQRFQIYKSKQNVQEGILQKR